MLTFRILGEKDEKPMSNDWNDLLRDIDMTLSGSTPAPIIETIAKPNLSPNRKVVVQKIISELWVYTDLDGKVFGHRGIQDVELVGEMAYEDALKMIAEKSAKKKRNS